MTPPEVTCAAAPPQHDAFPAGRDPIAIISSSRRVLARVVLSVRENNFFDPHQNQGSFAVNT
jgi:hypothetical protein